MVGARALCYNRRRVKHQFMTRANLHFRRWEFKYRVPIGIADRIIPQMLNYMDWDEYTVGDHGYEVNSLYLDSPRFKCYHEKLDGLQLRKKVRIRSYHRTIDKDSNLFFELKRKSGDVILKDRIIVKGEDYFGFLEDPFGLMKVEVYDKEFLNEYLYETSYNLMKPVVLVTYLRKAFVSRFDKRFRVTFDYNLSFATPEVSAVGGVDFDTDYERKYDDLVIMEVKFNGAMPKWFHDIIEMYGLRKDRFSKYCKGIEAQYGVPACF